MIGPMEPHGDSDASASSQNIVVADENTRAQSESRAHGQVIRPTSAGVNQPSLDGEAISLSQREGFDQFQAEPTSLTPSGLVGSAMSGLMAVITIAGGSPMYVAPSAEGETRFAGFSSAGARDRLQNRLSTLPPPDASG